jgi:hypothetical protein
MQLAGGALVVTGIVLVRLDEPSKSPTAETGKKDGRFIRGRGLRRVPG